MTTEWTDEAACRGLAFMRGYDLFYEEHLEAEAKSVCATCNVRLDCLQYALQDGIWYGVYGGMNPKERESHYRRWRYWSKRSKSDFTKESLERWNKEMAG